MATQYDFKSATPDTSFPSGAFLFGADSQSASNPSIYSSDAYLSYILTKTNSWTGAQTFTLQTTIPVGSLGTPSIVFAGSPNAGLYSANAGNVDFAANGAWIFRVSNGSGITAESGSAFNWSNTGGNPSASKDTGISRVSAGVVGIGTGASGSVAGSLSGAAATFSGSAPQVTLGVNATTLGSIKLFGNTSGDVTLQPTAVAGTATTLTLPATTSTLAGLAIAQTFTATQTITPGANTSALAVSGFSLTGSNAQSLLDLAGTWNTSGTPTAIDLNITDTTSNVDSLLFRLRTGGTQRMAVRKDGQIRVGSPTGALATTAGAAALLLAAGTTFQIAAENQSSSSSSAGAGVGLYSNDNAAMASGDRLGFFLFGGSPSAGSVVSSALIGAFATQTWSGSAYGTRIEFQTTADSSTSRTTKLILSSGGILAFGATLANTLPALKPSSTVLQARLGDDSDFAPLQGRLRSNANATAETPTATHTLRMFDASGTEYKLLAVAA